MKRSKAKMAGSLALAVALVASVTVQGGVAVADAQSISGTGEATVTTGEDGTAQVNIMIQTEGDYIIASTASQGVDCDTIGTLYDASGAEIAASDDNYEDTNFCMSQHLAAGSYKLEVQGKEYQEGASITVGVSAGIALNSMDCDYSVDDEGQIQDFQLGTWVKDGSTSWDALDASNYTVVGYAYQQIFDHAQMDGAVDKLQWSSAVPSSNGRYVVKVVAAGSTYKGAAYYAVENVDPDTALSETFPKVTTSICGAVSKVELGTETNTPTSWTVEWTAISSGDYTTVGYATCEDFEQAGGDVSGFAWTSGLPASEGSYVIKLSSTARSAHEGDTYVWYDIDECTHAGSGSWIIDKEATYTEAGMRHLVCSYCGSPCDYTEIPVLEGPEVGSTVTLGSGKSAAQYKVTTESELSYVKCNSKKAAAIVPATIKIGSDTYYVTGIGTKAFAKATKVKKVTVKTQYLVKSTMKKCLTGSKVTTVKVPKAVKTAYKKLFTKAICGVAVTVK